MTINEVFDEADKAFKIYKKVSITKKVDFLGSIVDELEALGDELLKTAHDESNLPISRLRGERSRTINQLRLFSSMVKEGSWVEATIDTALPDRKPLPRADLRRMLLPLGPVVVFGASNFPFAFSTAGGDTASALAAGCPVIYKEHPAHPKTSQMVFKAVLKALETCSLPLGIFQHVSGGIEIGQELVTHRSAKAVAFTGSYQAGKAIFDLACQREQPIPVYAEMGSVNPILVLHEKASKDPEQLAEIAAQSVLLGAGQFCTCPGLIFYPESDGLEGFIQKLAEKLREAPAEKMLHEGICNSYYSTLKQLLAEKGVEKLILPDEDVLLGKAGLARTSLKEWLQNAALQEEIFGPFTLIVTYSSLTELERVASILKGQLTCTIWGSEGDLDKAEGLIDVIKERCGRLLFGGVPTGVEVSAAMTHGGPFPTTTDSRSTSVGSYAIKRFARPFTYQSAPKALLPEELNDQNSLSIWRTVNNELTKESVFHIIEA